MKFINAAIEFFSFDKLLQNLKEIKISTPQNL